MTTPNAKVALGLAQLNVAGKAAQFKEIKAGMKDNPAFPDSAPQLADLEVKCQEMEDAEAEQKLALLAYKKSTAKLHQKTDAYEGGATQLGAYVEMKAAGDATVIQSANMPVKSDNTAKRPMTQVEDVSVTSGDAPGQVDVHFHGVQGAKAYLIRYGQNGPDDLSQKDVFVKSKGELHGLISGKEVWLQVCAKGADGQGPWSQPVRCMVP